VFSYAGIFILLLHWVGSQGVGGGGSVWVILKYICERDGARRWWAIISRKFIRNTGTSKDCIELATYQFALSWREGQPFLSFLSPIADIDIAIA